MNNVIRFCVLTTFLASSCLAEDTPGLKTVKARTIELKVPSGWQEQKSASQMRVAQFVIPAKPEPATMIVYYFGGPTGGIKANVDRWIGQFQKEGLELNMYEGECTAGKYILVDTMGTWNKPDGPPVAQKKIATPDSRVINVILIEKKEDEEDYYFLKLSGHKDIVTKLIKTVRTAIGAKADTEKEFKLPN